MSARRGKKRVLVLNSGMEPLHHVTPEHAIRMIDKGKATVLEEDLTRSFRSSSGVIVYSPLRLVLKKYAPMKWYYTSPLIPTKSGIMRRDAYRCAYCGAKADTVDHVVPESKGGKLTWENCVAACFSCNNKKDDKTLQVMGWTLRETPSYPTREQLIMNSYRKVKENVVT
jgi:5-methylcytosine-specific restriction endonuclease McrA